MKKILFCSVTVGLLIACLIGFYLLLAEKCRWHLGYINWDDAAARRLTYLTERLLEQRKVIMSAF